MTKGELITIKRDGGAQTPEQIQAIVRAVMDGSMPDYQVSAWLMAVFLRGMNPDETLALTLAMRDSGKTVDLSDIAGFKLDKHSSGGVGDKTTLVVVPILAAAGVKMLKMSGRGLGFSGGTVDKLESIPGFRVDLSIDEAKEQVRRIGAALITQSAELAPADKKLYALRDVTATVESLPLIASSIMSKKLASGADAIVLDVKVGKGAFMKDLDSARELAQAMVEIGARAGVKTTALLTAMDEPLGYAVGNALEVAEAVETLSGKGDPRFRELCLALTSHGLAAAGIAVKAEQVLDSGAALAKFRAIVEAQAGSALALDQLPEAADRRDVAADTDGFVQSIDAEAIGWASVRLGAGRSCKEDQIDPAVGFHLLKKTGDSVARNEPLVEIHCADGQDTDSIASAVREAYLIGPNRPKLPPAVYEEVIADLIQRS